MSDFLKLTGYNPAETTSRVNYPLPAIQTTPEVYTGSESYSTGGKSSYYFDNAPRLEKIEYQQKLPDQCGRTNNYTFNSWIG